jgi:hypothetical protein
VWWYRALKSSRLQLGIVLFRIPGQDADDADVYGDADDQDHEACDDTGARDGAFRIPDLITHRTDVIVAYIFTSMHAWMHICARV